jgi:hypothetical protein
VTFPPLSLSSPKLSLRPGLPRRDRCPTDQTGPLGLGNPSAVPGSGRTDGRPARLRSNRTRTVLARAFGNGISPDAEGDPLRSFPANWGSQRSVPALSRMGRRSWQFQSDRVRAISTLLSGWFPGKTDALGNFHRRLTIFPRIYGLALLGRFCIVPTRRYAYLVTSFTTILIKGERQDWTKDAS